MTRLSYATMYYDALEELKAAQARIATLEAQLRTLEAQAAYYGCPHCGKPITITPPQEEA